MLIAKFAKRHFNLICNNPETRLILKAFKDKTFIFVNLFDLN